jgi:hypothetical protein
LENLQGLIVKKLSDYLNESEFAAENPVTGDVFAINIREECLVESVVLEHAEDGIVIAADEKMMEIFESYGITVEDVCMECGLTECECSHVHEDNIEYAEEEPQPNPGEYDEEGDMAKTELHTMIRAARKLIGLLGDDDNMPEWTQKKITKATDYVDTAADYVASQKERGVMAEATPETTVSALRGYKTWQVWIKNNYYNGKYPDYSARPYRVIAGSADEARQVVLDNADRVLKDLLSKKFPSGKRVLPPKSALPIEAKHIGAVDDGTMKGQITTGRPITMLSPQGPMTVELDAGNIVDVVQGVEESKYPWLDAEKPPKQPDAPRLVRDRKTGKEYDPHLAFAKAMNSPEVTAQMKRMSQRESVAEGPEDVSPVARAVLHRIMMAHPGMLATHGPERVMSAVDELADRVNIGPDDEIGTSDVSGWVRDVIRMLSELPDESMSDVDALGEAEKKGLYYNVNKRKQAGTSRDKNHPKAPTAQAWKDAAKTAKTEGVSDALDESEIDDTWMNDRHREFYKRNPHFKRNNRDRVEVGRGTQLATRVDPAVKPAQVQKKPAAGFGMSEAEYQGRKVELNKPSANTDGASKSKVYVKDPQTGNVKKVTFGDPNMKIRKSNPGARKNFRARHNCANPGPKTKARYWSCRAW